LLFAGLANYHFTRGPFQEPLGFDSSGCPVAGWATYFTALVVQQNIIVPAQQAEHQRKLDEYYRLSREPVRTWADFERWQALGKELGITNQETP
jgi:hypothetical protein